MSFPKTGSVDLIKLGDLPSNNEVDSKSKFVLLNQGKQACFGIFDGICGERYWFLEYIQIFKMSFYFL